MVKRYPYERKCKCLNDWGMKVSPFEWNSHEAHCHWRLPIGSFSDKDGTIVNYHKGLNKYPYGEVIEVVW